MCGRTYQAVCHNVSDGLFLRQQQSIYRWSVGTSSRPSQRSGLVDVIRISSDDIRGECVIAFGL